MVARRVGAGAIAACIGAALVFACAAPEVGSAPHDPEPSPKDTGAAIADSHLDTDSASKQPDGTAQADVALDAAVPDVVDAGDVALSDAVSADGGPPRDATPPDTAPPDAVLADAVLADAAPPDVAPDAAPPVPAYTACTEIPYAVTSVPVPEASGATFVVSGDKRAILIISDSGNAGAGVRLDLQAEAAAPVDFPLEGEASDDSEGLSLGPDGVLYGITSSGYVREWTLATDGTIATQRAAYPLAAPGSPYVCDDGKATNCAANFEGLCMNPEVGGPCVGYAAGKTKGELVCLTRAPDGRLTIGDSPSIPVSANESLSGCHYTPKAPHHLLAVTNAFGGARLLRIEQGAAPQDLGVVAGAFPEAVAIDDQDRVFVFSDLATFTSGSVLLVFDCAGDGKQESP